MSEDSEIITIIDDRFWQSALNNAITFIVVVGVMGVGWLLGSSAMQWVGFVMLFLILLGRASDMNKSRMSAQAAADHLAEKYNVVATDREAA